jgi:hypothetical protein
MGGPRLTDEEKARRAALKTSRTQGAPPAGGSVQPGEGVRPQVMQMTGHATEEEMISSLPENTNQPTGDDDAPRRTRRPRQPRPVEPEADPLATDKRYQRAVGNGTFLGAPKIVKGGFSIAAKIADKEEIALNEDEAEEVDDYFYALSKRHPLGDPFATWYMSLLYFVAMIATLVGTRFAQAQGDEFQTRLARLFGYGPKEEEKKAAQ